MVYIPIIHLHTSDLHTQPSGVHISLFFRNLPKVLQLVRERLRLKRGPLDFQTRAPNDFLHGLSYMKDEGIKVQRT